MRKRLRKKLHLKEFREYGFEVHIFLKNDTQFEDVFAEIIQRFDITDYGAGMRVLEGTPIINAFFEIGRRFHIREEIIQWLFRDERVLCIFPKYLIDAYHCDHLLVNGKQVRLSKSDFNMYI